MKIYVNGNELETICRNPEEFLANAGLDAENMLIVLNSEALRREQFETDFQEGDRLELLRFAGGG